MSTGIHQTRWLLLLGFIVGIATPLQADWKDLWQSPEQRALQAYEEGDYESLLRHAPDDTWSGLGQFQAENYAEASQAFAARVEELRAAGDAAAANRALYNQGVSEVMAGQFEQAIERFDAVLAQDPEQDDALHNRNIAKELLKLQQQQNDPGQNSDQSQDGESGETGDQQDNQSQGGERSEQQPADAGEEEGEQSSDASSDSGEQGEQGDARQSASDVPSSNNAQNNQQPDPASQSAAQRQQEADDAREALAAEASQQNDQEQQGNSSEESDMSNSVERPLSEAEQAVEQLLRRIPDDPAGLLRRKLEQSHRNEYPEVRDAAEPW